MTFMNDLEKQLNNEKQLTENGAVGYRTSGKELLDLNFAVSSMRNWDENEICKAYIKAYYENPLLAVKWLFYLRDIRGNGMGERRAFRICFKWLVENHFDNVMALVELIPEYGRYDDWMCLLDSKAGEVVSVQIKKQLETDICNMEQGREISLLAKWLPSCNASSSQTKLYAKNICKMLGFKESEYRKTLSALRAYLNVVEVKMSAREWSAINYSSLPSRANLLYGNAFLRNDEERRREFLSKLSSGEEKINASTLFPSDIVHKYYGASERYSWRTKLSVSNETLEGLWAALPDYVGQDSSTLVVRDGSGSMQTEVGNTSVTALNVSTALAYQGEFEHEHINPIYIERMTLNEKDERMAYLNYLTNLYSKKNIRMDAENKPEYAGGSDDLLEQKYLGEYVPVLDDASGIWCVQTGYGFESGDINYIASEFVGTGLIYHFMDNGEMDHVHGFESVLVEILKDPEHVDIMTDYGEYSDQEVQMVKGIKRAAAFVQAHHRPMTVAELCKNRVEIKNKGEDDYGNSVQGNQAIFGKKR